MNDFITVYKELLDAKIEKEVNWKKKGNSSQRGIQIYEIEFLNLIMKRQKENVHMKMSYPDGWWWHMP